VRREGNSFTWDGTGEKRVDFVIRSGTNELSVLQECYAEGNGPIESLRRRWQIRSHIEFVLKDMWRYDIEWIDFWSGQVNVAMNCRVP
jgi:hypothetical protein